MSCLLGVVAARRTTVARALGVELERFVKQSVMCPDGWGAAYVNTAGELVVAKEPFRADGSGRLEALAAYQTTDAAILHLRHAAPADGPELGSTHPFSDGRTALAHHGEFTPASAIDASLGLRALATLEGRTDSERYYRLVCDRMRAGFEPAEALISAAATIRASAESFASLDSLLLCGDALYAYADHHPDAPQLYRYGIDCFDLRYRVAHDRVLVGSTGPRYSLPLSERLEPRHVLRIDRGDLRVTVVGERGRAL